MQRLKCFLLCLFLWSNCTVQAQDSTAPWFPDGDDGFYRYLENRLLSLGSQRPGIQQTGESVSFEFYVTDSGYIDSLRIGQCFNYQLCFQLRQILSTMPRVNATVIDGKTVGELHVFVLDFKRSYDGYLIEPSKYVPYTGSSSTVKLRWGIAVVAAIAMLLVIFK